MAEKKKITDGDFTLDRREFMISTLAAGLAISMPHKRKIPGNLPDPTPRAASTVDVNLKVNGIDHSVKVDSRTTLLDFLRENIQLTGTKKGCDHGQCGACTVMVNGRRINSCLSLLAQNQGKEIITIEGIANGEELHPMQSAFISRDAFQCGFCTPGQIISAVALLKEPGTETEDEIRDCMSGNLCRCGAYRNILTAIQDVKKAKSNGTV